MKTTLIIEIETLDEYEIFPEEGETKETYKDKKEELIEFRKDYAKNLHKAVVDKIKNIETDLEDGIIENLDELSIEDWYTFEDYSIEFNVKEQK